MAAAAGSALRVGALPAVLSTMADSSTVIREMTADTLTEMLLTVNQKISGSGGQAVELLGAAIHAVASGNPEEAVRLAQQVIAAHPEGAHTLAREPGLTPVRGEILSLVNHMTSSARAATVHTLDAAAIAVSTPGYGAMVNGLDPQLVLAVANQYFATGEYVNYLRAGALGRMLVERRRMPAPAPARAKRARIQLARLWKRAPMLILLGGWLAAGIVFGVGRLLLGAYGGGEFFNIWALGFLLLVGVQFVVTLRNSRY